MTFFLIYWKLRAKKWGHTIWHLEMWEGSLAAPSSWSALSVLGRRLSRLPQEMRDANIVTIYKNKGDRSNCNSYRGISLLSTVGKLFACVILNRLQWLASRVYPESQCGFRAGRSTIDMIFSLRQLQEQGTENAHVHRICWWSHQSVWSSQSQRTLSASWKDRLSWEAKTADNFLPWKGLMMNDGSTLKQFQSKMESSKAAFWHQHYWYIIFLAIVLRIWWLDWWNLHSFKIRWEIIKSVTPASKDKG